MSLKENIIISANPGSGKTEKIANEVIKKIQEGTNPKDILCITFTRKAMGEMHERILKKMVEGGLNFNPPRIETFHSFSLSFLMDRNIYAGTVSERFMRYSIIQSMSKRNLMNYGVETLMKDYPYIINVGKLLNAIKFLKSYNIYPNSIDKNQLIKDLQHLYETEGGVKGYTNEEMKILGEKFIQIFSDYEMSKKIGYLDYNDYLVKAIEYMKEGYPRYRYVFVDEVQDISDIESQIIMLSGEKYFLVGDRKQAIFGFQGGNTKSFEKFLNDERFLSDTINGTRRLPENIKNYCMNFYQISEPEYAGYEFGTFDSHVKDWEGKVDLIISDDEKSIYELVAQVAEQIEKNSERNQTIGIISRTNTQAEEISSVLTSHNIAHQKISGEIADDEAGRDIYLFLRGIFSDRVEHIIAMLYTPFSGLSLKDAMHYSDSIKFSKNPEELLPEEIKFVRKKYTKDKKSIRDLFNEYIIPYSINLSPQYFFTSKDIAGTLDEYFQYIGMENFTSLDDFLLFVAQSNSSEDEIPEYSRVNVLTVHKAKGLQFDHVIYIPKYVTGKDRSPVDTVVELILKQFGHTYGFSEREREENRIDFVALSRAKRTLSIITGKKNRERYNIQPCSLKNGKLERSIENQFVSLKSLMEREKKERKEPWILNYIEKKMKGFQNLSFTMMSNLKKGRLENFVITYILGIREGSSAADFGTTIHGYIEDYIKNGKKPQNLIDPDELEAWKNFADYDRTIKEVYKGEWKESELKIRRGVKEILQNSNDPVNIDGRIDGVYTYMDGDIQKYVVVDFKTSKKPNSDYTQQLSLYAYLFSLERSISLERIESEISYLSLREEKVNTGKMKWKNERIPSEIEMRSFEDVKEYIEKFILYRSSIDAFIRDILEEKASSRLFIKFQEELREQCDN